jgi:hypothetical protein
MLRMTLKDISFRADRRRERQLPFKQRRANARAERRAREEAEFVRRMEKQRLYEQTDEYKQNKAAFLAMLEVFHTSTDKTMFQSEYKRYSPFQMVQT